MIKHFLNRWYIRVQRKEPQTAKYSLYVWSLRWLWYIFAKIKTKITMPCEAIFTPNLSKLLVNFLSEYFITSIEMSKWNLKFRFLMVTATMFGKNFFKSDLNEFVLEKSQKLRRFTHNTNNEPQLSLYKIFIQCIQEKMVIQIFT